MSGVEERKSQWGPYVALDGPDGCGKSSQAVALAAWLAAEGQDVVHVREPGSTPVGEALRDLLLSNETGELQPITEVLLFSAARAELMQRVISPARARGAVVVAERCYLSTAVYQILATETPQPGVLDARWFEDLTRRVHGACLPDAIFVLDVPAEVSVQRRGSRVDDRIEARGEAYHRRVRDGYLQAAEREPRAKVFDSAQPFDVVQDQLRAVIRSFL
ncbi:MAG: dTMP kinase [Planctomycetota bacterium]